MHCCAMTVLVRRSYEIPPFRDKLQVRPFQSASLVSCNSASMTSGYASIRCLRLESDSDCKEVHKVISQEMIDKHLLDCCESEKKLKVAVLVSGGVDSSVALRLLCAAGHSCTAFYLKIWFQDDFENLWSACPWEEDLKFAQDVCDEIGVKLEVLHFTDLYWKYVVSKCIAEVESGRTPNPDVLCNTRIKFGAFLDYIGSTGFDRVASGHYAKIERSFGKKKNLITQLKLSKDEVKDQTYFLAYLSQEQLSRLIFPLGNLSKMEVRKVANMIKLCNKDRKDSQGICFLGKVKFREFIERHLGQREGCIVEAESGNILGKHNGFWFYTIGQRKGLTTLSNGPWYVVAKDPKKNLVYVSKKYFSGDKQRCTFHVSSLNWIFPCTTTTTTQLRCKVRHSPKMYDCEVKIDSDGDVDGDGVVVRLLNEEDEALAAGQYAVFYEGDVCLGSGIISQSLHALDSCTVSPHTLAATHDVDDAHDDENGTAGGEAFS